MPKVSVLLSVYNGAMHLRESIDSVLAQSEPEFELLIVDDGSSDGSQDIVATYQDPRIRSISIDSRRGLYPNLNLMAELARAPLLKPWAQDDIMHEDCLRHGILFHAAYPQAVVSYCNLQELRDQTGTISQSDDATPAILEPAMADWYLVCHGSLCGNVSTLFMPREPFRQVGRFDNHISADFGMLVKCAGIGAIGHIAHFDVVVRHHQAQWSRNSTSGLRTLIANADLYRTLITRCARHADGSGLASAPAVLAEVLGRNATSELIRGLLAGHWRLAISAWRAIRDYVSPWQMIWHLGRRRFGLPRLLP